MNVLEELLHYSQYRCRVFCRGSGISKKLKFSFKFFLCDGEGTMSYSESGQVLLTSKSNQSIIFGKKKKKKTR